MSELKRTVLYDAHVAAGATMVDFGGWEMPIQYPSGIVAEHLYTRRACGIFDVSHMGRLLISGPDRLAFLQYALSRNVATLTVGQSQYGMIPAEDGSAVDDAYLCRYAEENYLLVVNASNTDKVLAHFAPILKNYDCTVTNITSEWAAVAVQGPDTERIMKVLTGGEAPTAPVKNALGEVMLEGHEAKVAKTGYTGEPCGYEVYVKSEDAVWFWNRLIELGAKPTGLGARDTLRMEASMPLYGHEMGVDAEGKIMPIHSVWLAKFAVSFAEEKGDFVGRKALAEQREAFTKMAEGDFSLKDKLPKKIMSIALVDRGVMRGGMEVFCGDKQMGWVTSGTMIPYYVTEIEGDKTVQKDETGKRAIGLCYVDSSLKPGDTVEVDVRGKRLKAMIVASHMKADVLPYVRPVLAK